VTGSAGLADIHVTHGYRLSVNTCRHYFVMAVVAAVASPHMNLMAKHDRLDILLGGEVIFNRLENRVTLLTVVSNCKSVLAVMTVTA